MICISIGNQSLIREVNALKPSLVEIRYDLLRREPALVAGELDSSILQVATCRPGIYPDEDRMQILKDAMVSGALYVDVEIESSTDYLAEIGNFARERKVHLIISYHNYDETPSTANLKDILETCYEKGADVAKIACQVKDRVDNLRLLSLYAEQGRKVVIGMGQIGRITRYAGLDLGAEFSFASISDDASTASGQLTYQQFQSIQKTLQNA